ncbi:RICIN domain-containing protein [Streptomyces sp. NPDC001185]|uniref:RICIN domain-containing protein n=1 Tax=Streptomyces sp. NPDC001185 TaxID=3154380 RepID=UPI0033335D21
MTAAQIWSCNGTGAQKWSARPDGTLRAVGECLDATGGGTDNASKAQIWDCNPASGCCPDDPASSDTDSTQAVLWDCNGGPNQCWTTLPFSA